MKKLLPHIILIPLLLTIPVVSSPDFDGTLSVFRVSPFQREFIRFVLVIIFFYINLNIFLPKFYSRKKYGIFACCIILSFGIMVFMPYYLTSQHIFVSEPSSMSMTPHEMMPLPNGNPSPPPMENASPSGNSGPRNDGSYYQMIFASVLPFLFSFLSSLFIFRNMEKKELERSKAKAELLNLKYQLQPHFLFNILNSVYSLALMKSDDAPSGILRLSNVMRYVVQESSKDFVDLSREIEYLKDYTALQLIRADSSLDFSYTEDGETEGLQIAPFILVNFIENAFKYGLNAEENSKIAIKIMIKEKVLSFNAFNHIVSLKTAGDNSLKVGMKNTVEHLNQVYPEKHSLNIHNDGNTFDVNLKIDLT
ncbi:histidine kinase [Chryseobacterium sp. RP-3-3]|uniref:Histidine kinase n=1 Tax=Chryseobacterium antibioticum TaxID=2728847 RepID=A0A7Y0FSJ4_9FLAO|nr:sensor histidine kinase [Chryseobacterium antibioticum]NML70726.1 histidine kinase [Chryseobacterium antibioticum]